MARRMRSGIFTRIFIRRCCGRRRCGSIWWVRDAGDAAAGYHAGDGGGEIEGSAGGAFYGAVTWGRVQGTGYRKAFPESGRRQYELGRRGEPGGIRTHDPRLKRALLYQLSYELTTNSRLTQQHLEIDVGNGAIEGAADLAEAAFLVETAGAGVDVESIEPNCIGGPRGCDSSRLA